MIELKNDAIDDWGDARLPKGLSLIQKNFVLSEKINQYKRQRTFDEERIMRQDFEIQDLEHRLFNVTMQLK